MSEKTKDFIRNNAGYFAVALICLVYIATAFVTIGKTGKSVGEIIAEGAVSFFLGIFISRLMDLQGIMLGERDETMIATHNIHSKAVIKISPYIDRLDEWCNIKNAEALLYTRKKILVSAGMKYDDYFDGDNPKAFKFEKCKSFSEWIAQFSRYRTYRKALKPKLTELSANALTSEGGKVDDINYLGMSKSEYALSTGTEDIVSKIAVAAIFGYYGVDMLANFSPATLIWRSLQVGMFLVMGTIKLYRSYRFVVDDYRNRIIKKTDHLQKFDNYIQNEEKKKDTQKDAESEENKENEQSE